MRVATLIIGLVLMLGVFVQSLIAAAGGSLASDKDLQNAAAWGILVSLGYLVGSALVVAKPRFSMWTFLVTATIAILAGATSAFSDLIVWGVIALILAALAWRGSIEKRRKDALEAQQRADVALTAAAIRARATEPTPVV